MAHEANGAVGMLARTTARARVRSIIAGGLLLGLVAGAGLACLAGARRTASQFERHLAATDASNLEIDAGTLSADSDKAIRQLPGTVETTYWVTISAFPLTRDGVLDEQFVGPIAFTSDGRFLTMDEVVVSDGRRLDAARDDEIMLNETFAEYLGVGVGDRVPIGLFPSDENGVPVTDVPTRTVDADVVGIMQLNEDVTAESFDRIPRMFVSPAFQPPDSDEPGGYYGFTWYGLRLAGGDEAVDDTIRAWRELATEHNQSIDNDPEREWLTFTHRTADLTRKVDRAVRPLVIALTGFGLLLTVAGIVLVSQSMSRSIRQGWDDIRTAQVLGLRPGQAMRVGMVVPVATIVLAAGVAGATAAAVSPTFPIGAYSVLEPSPGIAFDPLVLVVGLAALVLIPLVVAARTSRRHAWEGTTDTRLGPARPSWLTHRAARAGVPPPAVAAIRLTTEPGRGRSFVPTRSVMVSVVITVIVAMAALLFGANLDDLANRPDRFGWRADAILAVDGGYATLDPQQVQQWAAVQADLEGWRVVGADLLTVAGVETPGVTYGPGEGRTDEMVPVVVSGRAPVKAGEVVLGQATLTAADAQIGDRLSLGTGDTTREVTVTGTAVFPVLGPALASRTGLDRGVWVTPDDADSFNSIAKYGPPFNFVEVALAPGADPAAVGRSALDPPFIGSDLSTSTVDVFDVVEPAEISNAASAGRVQGLLVIALAVLAAISMLFTLLAVVRRRRSDLDIYRALGFTPRQVRGTILGQGLAFGLCGVILGTPLGLALGRELWRRFAIQVGVVPDPVMPWGPVAALVGVVIVASLASALWPAWESTRRSHRDLRPVTD